MTDAPIPPVDLGNQLLAAGPAQLTTAVVDTPDGKKLAMTLRTPSSTTTVFLERDDARTWGNKILTDADQMTGLTVVREETAARLLSASFPHV